MRLESKIKTKQIITVTEIRKQFTVFTHKHLNKKKPRQTAMHNKMTGQANCANAEKTAEIKITHTPKLDYSMSHVDIHIKSEARADCSIELF